MNTVWVVIGLGVAVAAIFGRFWHRPGQTEDLGSVSHQWLAEHRQGSSRESSRR